MAKFSGSWGGGALLPTSFQDTFAKTKWHLCRWQDGWSSAGNVQAAAEVIQGSEESDGKVEPGEAGNNRHTETDQQSDGSVCSMQLCGPISNSTGSKGISWCEGTATCQNTDGTGDTYDSHSKCTVGVELHKGLHVKSRGEDVIYLKLSISGVSALTLKMLVLRSADRGCCASSCMRSTGSNCV